MSTPACLSWPFGMATALMMEQLGTIENKEVKKYTHVFSDSHHKHGAIKTITNFKSHLL